MGLIFKIVTPHFDYEKAKNKLNLWRKIDDLLRTKEIMKGKHNFQSKDFRVRI